MVTVFARLIARSKLSVLVARKTGERRTRVIEALHIMTVPHNTLTSLSTEGDLLIAW